MLLLKLTTLTSVLTLKAAGTHVHPNIREKERKLIVVRLFRTIT